MAEVAKAESREHQVLNHNTPITFIQNQELATTDSGPGKRQYLTLTGRKVSSPTRNCGLQRNPSLAILALDQEQTRSPESIFESSIVMLAERIQVCCRRYERDM